MGVVKLEKEPHAIRQAMREKFLQKLDGRTIADPMAFMKTEEAQTLLKEAQGEAETFYGYTLEEAKEEDMLEDMAHEIKWKMKSLNAEDELKDCEPESIM